MNSKVIANGILRALAVVTGILLTLFFLYKIQSVIISPGNESDQKADYIRSLGVESVAAIGQGANDARMLKEAKLGICILSPEGTAVETLLAADLVAPDIFKGLEILDKPIRIIADLRK